MKSQRSFMTISAVGNALRGVPLRRGAERHGGRCLQNAAVIAMYACLVLASSTTFAQRASDESVTLAGLRALAIEQAVAQVRPAVVQVRLIGDYRSLGREATGAMTGLLLDRRWVVTSSFGLGDSEKDQRPAGVIVAFAGGGTRSAELVSTDHGRQLALLRLIDPAPGAMITLEPQADAQPGETAIGIGVAYSAADVSASVGIVSATGRIMGRAIQTDAATSPANYGGPLVDLRGRVLGLLTPLGQDVGGGAEWYDSGIGFAIPLGDILERLPRMQSGEDIHPGKAGLSFSKGNALVTAPKVRRLAPDGPAAQGGVKQGDVITAVAGKPVATQQQLRFALGPYDAGDKVTLELERGDERLTVELTLVAAADLPQEAKEQEAPSLLERLKLQFPQPE